MYWVLALLFVFRYTLQGLGPVSYTHLDVYKRQVLSLLKCLRGKREYFTEVIIFNIVFYIA